MAGLNETKSTIQPGDLSPGQTAFIAGVIIQLALSPG